MPEGKDTEQHYSIALENEHFDLTGAWRISTGRSGKERIEVQYETYDRTLAYRAATRRERRLITGEGPSYWGQRASGGSGFAFQVEKHAPLLARLFFR